MKLLAGKPLVQHVLERIRRAKKIDDVILATSTSPKDDVLEEHVRSLGFRVYRGSEDDVLGRILGAAHFAEATVHVQCWGDCACLDPDQIDRVVEHLVGSDWDLVGNTVGAGVPKPIPPGLDVLAMRVSALERADRETKDNAYHREHGSTYIYETRDRFKTTMIEPEPDLRLPQLKLVVDKPEDFEFITSIYDELYPRKPDFRIRDILALVKTSPKIAAHPNAQAVAAELAARP